MATTDRPISKTVGQVSEITVIAPPMRLSRQAAAGAECAPGPRPDSPSEIGTIHFARWVIFDNDTRLLFTSNFDGDWVATSAISRRSPTDGMDRIFSHCDGYPEVAAVISSVQGICPEVPGPDRPVLRCLSGQLRHGGDAGTRGEGADRRVRPQAAMRQVSFHGIHRRPAARHPGQHPARLRVSLRAVSSPPHCRSGRRAAAAEECARAAAHHVGADVGSPVEARLCAERVLLLAGACGSRSAAGLARQLSRGVPAGNGGAGEAAGGYRAERACHMGVRPGARSQSCFLCALRAHPGRPGPDAREAPRRAGRRGLGRGGDAPAGRADARQPQGALRLRRRHRAAIDQGLGHDGVSGRGNAGAARGFRSRPRVRARLSLRDRFRDSAPQPDVLGGMAFPGIPTA